ncbi:MAG TPA: uroporphyrinogen decarboxylase family protein [Patescibacteria group bacterium]|jgi:uroporphyrinogen-III decarboxylase|nr:uroporphyrinogen decarboxylase family protein [Patescibacteria group bacterium]
MNTEELYQRRLSRYVTAMRNEKPDCVPIRPFVAEFTGKYSGYTCQEVAHDYSKAFEAAVAAAKAFDWDAVVPNMVYVWTGLAQAMGLRYYGIPGIGIPHQSGFNYIEPSEDHAFMRADEYDALIEDPTAFLYNTWLPRVSTEVAQIGEPATYRNNLALVKGAMAMLSYFYAFGPQIARLRSECGTVSAISGIFKAPFDILADKLRGYVGLTLDMHTQPQKVLQACEALMPHLCHVGLTTADPAKQVPIGFWMHRGCVPFINPKQFASHNWPTLKPIIQEFWKHGHQTLFYAEGKWHHHFDAFRELPDRSIVFHCDQDDIFNAHQKLHDKFALSGGVPNVLLSFGKPDEVRSFCTKVLHEVASEGGYIMDAGAIMQDDTSIENLQVLTETTRQYGVYPAGSFSVPVVATPPCDLEASVAGRKSVAGMTGRPEPAIRPGVCLRWEDRLKELPEITGKPELIKKIWEDIDAFGNTYIWQLLLSF